ncbi:hypothetical protein Rumeso_02073 [Rubellimicrobium mesophilum DSM 19309]|uniref:Uncharacterized protein n=1 Tax=Rubellimicrobium mesophilum DSM 19309 TaxID=442562 RepID=A0A017HQ99_9RHOB|nr:hypothetical protein [Rubellimicrobium mesophilum]EYD76353.1 hypothetical protein Rumeso_02073 [Rubellimicrobium mesophilum DSM 19309]
MDQNEILDGTDRLTVDGQPSPRPEPPARPDQASPPEEPRDPDRPRASEAAGRGSRRIQVREVTQYQVSWVEREPGEEGRFTIQLILDNGVEEYLLDVDSDDMEPLLRLLGTSGHTTFDLARKVLMFSNLGA